MPTFTNKSTEIFQDGDLMVAPGESLATEDESRIDMFRGQYAWQFSEADGEDGQSEADLQTQDHNVREVRSASHVAVDEDGAQSEVVGSPEPAENSEKAKSTATDQEPAAKKK